MNVLLALNVSLPDDWNYPGHGTGALGPSDSSDSGSDMQGPGDSDDDEFFGRDRKSDPSADDTVINYATPHRGLGA